MTNSFDWRSLRSMDVLQFAIGVISGREFYDRYRNTPLGGKVRNLLRLRGVTRARELARRAAKRAANRMNKVS